MDQSVRERMDALESRTNSQDVSSIVHQNISSINNNGTEEPHTKRTASEAFQHISTSQDVTIIDADDEDFESPSTSKRSKRTEASTSGGQSDSKDVSSTLHHNTSSINDNGTEEPHTSKRTASEAFRHISTSQDVPVIIIDADSDDEEVESTSTSKRSKRTEASTSGGQSDSEASNGEFDADIVFAMDYSSSLSEEELEMEIDFVIKLAESLNVTPGKSKAALVVYGDSAQTVIPFNSGDKNEKKFYVQPGELKTRALSRSKCRRMDLALTKAADNLSAIKPRNQNQHHLVVLITAGKQLTNEECEEENDLLLSASEALSSSSVKVIIVPVGLETDFKELGLIVKRPQSLFPFSFFRELTPDKAEGIAFYIKKTIDIDAYAKEQLSSVMLSGIPTGLGLWEKISLCSDVLEGAWYLLYDDQKKPRKPQKPQKIKKLIRESIDNFHSTLVSKSKICISLAVFGPLGAGKSFFLNFLLNQGLSETDQVKNGPLPSAIGGSQTPLPIYVKYGKKVQVLLHKQKKGVSPDVLFPEETLGNGTLARVNTLLKTKFQEVGSFSDANCIELQGPFPVFHHLKERAMTTFGHLELEVDVEFVDVPGLGAEIGNESINTELSKADMVLFFDNGKSGRPVSAEDIAQIFRRREEFEFTSRPKLVHVVNDRGEPSDFDHLCEQKKKDLERAWLNFFPSNAEDETKKTTSDCYKDVRAKLPQLNGEALLEKLSQESEVIYFHVGNSGFLKSLKNVINDHVQNVKIKETVHPFLQNVHWAAKKLRTRIGNSLITEKKKSQAGKAVVKEVQRPNFEMLCNSDQVSNLISCFLEQSYLPLESDIGIMYRFLYDVFLNSEETLEFLLDSLKVSLENFRRRLIEAYKNANWSTSQNIPGDLIDLVEILCESRVQQFCSNSAPTYLRHVLEKGKNRNPFGKQYKKRWSSASAEEKVDMCLEFLQLLLKRAIVPLVKETRDKQYRKSHFQFMAQLEQDVKDLFAVRCLDEDASRLDLLKSLIKPLHVVIDFCTKSIREINPHPSLDVQADISLPEKMKDAHENSTIPLQSDHNKIIKDMTDLLLKPATKGADVILGKLESKLNLGKGALVLREPQSAEQKRLWAKAVVNVISDEYHFDILIDSSLILDPHDPEVDRLLNQARQRLFAHQKSSVTCKIVNEQALPDNEIHLRKSSQEEFCLEVLVSSKMCNNLDTIREAFKDPMQQIAPIFMPTVRPGPTADMRGNFFLEEDPWSKDVRIDDIVEQEGGMEDEVVAKESKAVVLDLNIFLVVEQQHLKTLQSTVDGLELPTGRNIKLMYVVLPQKGRGIGVTRAIIKSLAECLNFSLYWTINDNLQFMYQFDGNDRNWHKCSLSRGLLFGQRVFQTCLEKTVKELTDEERNVLLDDVTSNWPKFAKKTKYSARSHLLNDKYFAEVQKNPSLLHSPFSNITEDCGGDAAKEEVMKALERDFVDVCRKRLFEDTVNHIAGISLAHESTRKCDYMSKYPTADYMRSNQRYQVVLNNTCALKKMNFVTDEVIFHGDEFQILDDDQRNTPCWGINGSDKSFCRTLTVSGVIGYQVIRVIHSHKKLTNVFDRVEPSVPQDEDEEDMDVNS